MIGAYLAHICAGGDFRSLSELFAQSFLVVTLLLIAGKRELQGPALALLILVAQSAVHLILGGASGNSIAMAFAHGIAGVLSYHLVLRAEKIGEAILLFAHQLLSQIFYTLPEIRSEISSPVLIGIRSLIYSEINISHGMRAPPLAVANV